MPKYKITFKHVQEIEYETEIEASSKAEAKKLFNDDPFGSDPIELDVQGIDVKFESIEEL